MRNLPASSHSFRGTHTMAVLTKTERPDTPHGMTDQPSRPDSHDRLLEDPDKSGHPWSHNPNGGIDTPDAFR